MDRTKHTGKVAIGKFVWREVTRNCWIADVDRNASICVTRNRSWKKFHADKPWKVELFGCMHNGLPWQPTLDDAKYLAERECVDELGRIAERMGFVHEALAK